MSATEGFVPRSTVTYPLDGVGGGVGGVGVDDDIQNPASRSFWESIKEKHQSVKTAISVLLVLGIFFFILGVILQILFCNNPWWSSVWIVGALMLVTSALVYHSGENVRTCYENARSCRQMFEAVQ